MQPECGAGPPSAGELSRRLHVSTAEILAARETWLALDADSLDAPAPGRDELESQPLGETIGRLDDGYERVDYQLTLEALLPRLPTPERRVLHMRFVEELTQADIAARLGVSQMHVSRVLRRALERLESFGHDLRSS
jgi:RNA polymerase sigma-B factor